MLQDNSPPAVNLAKTNFRIGNGTSSKFLGFHRRFSLVQQSGYGATTEGRGFQKRIDKLTRKIYDQKAEMSEMHRALQRYQVLVEKYKLALRQARKGSQHGQ
jgi:hypothetical protein